MNGGPCIAVAWSGGRDSTALLHATLMAAKPHGLRVAALHVHHGLSPNADAWLEHCERLCERWAQRGYDVTFQATRLVTKPARGESVEAWARKARYQALRRMAVEQGAAVVLLAQHRLDQAETVLLQALRGAGVAGLSGMPRHIERDGITWERPWLDRNPEAIAAYVRRHRLVHIDDESNHDPRYARNRLRIDVWPVLSKAFPDAQVTLADAASWAQQATACLAELAAQDLAALVDARGLQVAGLLALSPSRRDNALRHWLAGLLGTPAPASLTLRLIDELPSVSAGSWPTRAGELRLYRGRLRVVAATTSTPTSGPRETNLSVRRAGRYALPGWGGALHVERVRASGVPLAWLAHVDLRERSGGEQFQAGIGRPPRSLKKQFQARGISAWERDGPLLYSGGQLVFVPGLGLDARVIGLPGQAQMQLTWRAAAAPPVEDGAAG